MDGTRPGPSGPSGLGHAGPRTRKLLGCALRFDLRFGLLRIPARFKSRFPPPLAIRGLWLCLCSDWVGASADYGLRDLDTGWVWTSTVHAQLGNAPGTKGTSSFGCSLGVGCAGASTYSSSTFQYSRACEQSIGLPMLSGRIKPTLSEHAAALNLCHLHRRQTIRRSRIFG